MDCCPRAHWGCITELCRQDGALLREIYTDASGTPKVESVVVKGLGHAFPIRIGGVTACGRPGDFVVDVKVCAASEIARFWGLEGNR